MPKINAIRENKAFQENNLIKCDFLQDQKAYDEACYKQKFKF